MELTKPIEPTITHITHTTQVLRSPCPVAVGIGSKAEPSSATEKKNML